MRGEDWGGGEGNISTSTAWRPLSLELFQLSPLTSRQIVIAWCASGRIEYGERQNVVKEEFHFESATQPFELTDEIATIVFNRLFTFVIKNKLERERERERAIITTSTTTPSVIWRVNDSARGRPGRRRDAGVAVSCRKTDVSALPSAWSSAKARSRACAGWRQRGGRDLLRQTPDSVSRACSFRGRSGPPSSSRPSLTGRGKSTWSWSSCPSCVQSKRSRRYWGDWNLFTKSRQQCCTCREWGRESAPSWPGVPGCRASERVSRPGKVQRGCIQPTTRHKVASSPAL